MQKIFVISQCDKLSHNLAMTCKHLYLTDLRNEILNNQTYKKLDHQDILQWGLQEIGVPLDDPSYFYRAGLIKHQIFNEAKNLQHVNNMFYLYAIQKIHKQKQRYVAGVGKPLMAIPYNEGAFIQQIILGGNGEDTDSDNGSGSERSAVVEDDNSTVDLEDERLRRDRDIIGQRHSAKIHRPKCSTTEASKELSKQLTMIIELLQEKDSLNEEYKRCFITRKAEEVFTMIKNNQQVFDKLQPRTFDFTTLYTKLPLQQIVENMQIAIDEAMEYKNGLGNGAAITAKYIELKSAAELMEYVNFIVHNTFVANSVNAVYHQRVGIPMGTNCAPELATLVLYVWEARYITELVSNNRLEEAKLHKYTKRYIDDIITFNTNAIPMEAYGGLEYTEQTQADGSVTFLGAKFHNSGERFRISVFDKAKEWPLHVIRYPSVHSNTPHHQSKGIYIGELRRYQLMVNS
jgi:hypothetical protein